MKKVLLVFTLIPMCLSNGFSQSEKKDLKLTVAVLPLFGSSLGFTSSEMVL